MIKTDYHMHTSYSFDSKDRMEDRVKAAIEKNLTEIAITEHMDFAYPSCQLLHPMDLTQYCKECAGLAEQYKEKITVAVGIEMGIGHHCGELMSRLCQEHPFDFVIGSYHDCKGVDFYYPEFYKGKSKKEAYTCYFEDMLECVQICGSFDVLGHMDYAERYGNFEDKTMYYEDYAPIIDEILITLIKSGRGIEVNTSGYAHGLGHPHPRFEIIKRYKELGGEIITVGSDAHGHARVGIDVDLAEELLLAAGFKAITVFRKRKPVFIDIK